MRHSLFSLRQDSIARVAPETAAGTANRGQSAEQVQDVDAATLKQWLATGSAVLVDVREDDEYAEEHIPGATLMPLSRFVPSSLPLPANKKTVLHCLAGGRSQKAGQMLLAAGFGEALHLEGGLLAWVAAGGATRRTA